MLINKVTVITYPKSCFNFQVSPSHKPSKAAVEVKEEVSVLRLVHFTHSPKIDFDKVKLGTQRKRILRVLNPKDVTQEVSTLNSVRLNYTHNTFLQYTFFYFSTFI